jgi:hypothetical protein
MKEDEMGGACRIHERNEKFVQKFVSTNVKGRHRWGNLGVNGCILKLMWTDLISFRIGLKGEGGSCEYGN